MFEYLKVTNHQGHRETLLEFSKGVNVIFGLSLSGKTSLLRSMGLIIYNRPSGCKFYSNFATNSGSTTIELKPVGKLPIILEKMVKRKKDKTKELDSTTYKYGSDTFTGVAREVPDTIKNVFNISELNIQKQFDGPFLILSSAGEFAKTINRVTKLDKVDDWVRDFTKKINLTKNEVEWLEKQSKEIEQELSKYVDFDNLAVAINEFNQISSELKKTESNYARIDGLLNKIETIDDSLLYLTPALQIQTDIDKLSNIEDNIVLVDRQISLINKIRMISSDTKMLGEILADMKKLESIEEYLTSINRQMSLTDKARIINDKIGGMSTILDDMRQLEAILQHENKFNDLNSYLARIELIDDKIQDDKKEYDNLEMSLIKMLEGTKECPIFQLQCPVVSEMTAKVREKL